MLLGSYSFDFSRIIYLCSYSFFLPELILHKYSVEGYPYIYKHNNTQSRTQGPKAHDNSPLPLNQDQFAPVVKFAHSLALLELVLPLLDQISSLAQALNLITLSVLCPCRSENVQLRPHLARPAPMFHVVVNQCFRPGVLVGNTPGSFHVGQQIFLCLRGFALEVMSFPPHFTCLGTNHFMSRTTVTDFPERATQFCMCFFVCGPAVREFP